jgi:aspartyl protease family protein
MGAAPDWQNDAAMPSRGEPVFEVDKDGRRVVARTSSGKATQFAVVMLGAGVVLALAIGVLMPAPLERPTPAAPPPRLNVARPAPAVPKPVSNMLQYRADASGHYFIDADVNGATIRFLLDTGASFVTLSQDDARAAGIADGLLNFSETMNTANGTARAAAASLRSVRLEQLEVREVPAMVMQQAMPVSLLGMSFLNRLNGYSIKDGVLTIEW